MEWVVFGVILLLLVVVLSLTVAQKRKWKTLLESRGMTDDIANKYSYLLDQGIRCRLREITSSSAAQPSMAVADAGKVQKVRIEVHRDDYEKAKALLQQYSSQESYSPLSSV
jgi:hypothetical protein